MIPKFRAWNTIKKEFLYFDTPVVTLSDDGYAVAFKNASGPTKMLSGYCDPEQSTGLKDKKGTEIFEGDILSFDKSKMPAVVERVHGDLNMKVMTPKGLRWYRMFNNYDPIPERLHYHAVIGNIHQHPELLK